jgi:hypothetical protein
MSRSGSVMNDEYRKGFAAALSSFAIAVGINPESILHSDDVKLLRENSI